jgi:hypothetical protein
MQVNICGLPDRSLFRHLGPIDIQPRQLLLIRPRHSGRCGFEGRARVAGRCRLRGRRWLWRRRYGCGCADERALLAINPVANRERQHGGVASAPCGFDAAEKALIGVLMLVPDQACRDARSDLVSAIREMPRLPLVRSS